MVDIIIGHLLKAALPVTTDVVIAGPKKCECVKTHIAMSRIPSDTRKTTTRPWLCEVRSRPTPGRLIMGDTQFSYL